MKKRLTINLTDEQHARLVHKAGNRTLAEYSREQLFGKNPESKVRIRKPKNNEVMLARVLAALGSSNMAVSMRDIAAAARNGALPESPSILLDLQAACLTIQKIRVDLIKALGIKPVD
ncbi:hypothetical protein A8B75_18580 [Sphingomonadales bacterium EhC05]|nr:hypothetical protein A8B75_18580 [Sphingomonadales bacterium EhC05]